MGTRIHLALSRGSVLGVKATNRKSLGFRDWNVRRKSTKSRHMHINAIEKSITFCTGLKHF